VSSLFGGHSIILWQAALSGTVCREAFGRNREAVHRACAKQAQMKIPSPEDYERTAIKIEPAT